LVNALGNDIPQLEGMYSLCAELSTLTSVTEPNSYLQLSYNTPKRFQQTAEWLSKTRRAIGLFVHCQEASEDLNEARLASYEIIESFMGLLTESVKYLQKNPNGQYAERAL
jgi:hypothetical protein